MSTKISVALNHTLKSGWTVSFVKMRQGIPLMTLCITNYIDTYRVILDVESNTILNDPGFKIEKSDIEAIKVALEKKTVKAVAV